MSKYFDWPASLKRMVRFDAARAEDVNAALDELTAGLDTLDMDVDRAIKLPSGASDQTLSLSSGQRANLLLAFDASGSITAVAGGGRYRGDWLTATAYVVGDYFRDPVSKNVYSTVSVHTSGVLATDIAAGRVQLAINVADVEAAKAAAEAAALAAAGQVTLAAGQVALATTQAGVATTQAGIATGAASTATTQAGVATTQAINAANIYENFDKRYLGAKASDPALDNQGAALTAGALYFNTSVNEMRSWNGSAWEAAYLPASGYVTEAPSDGKQYARKNAGWEMTGVAQRSARTSNTELSAADGGKWIDITSGTFTQTFAAAATLGDGWWCYLGNSGTGDITLTPSGAETIDGLASFVMYPGEVRLVQCDGLALRSVVMQPFRKTFTASGTFVKPPGYTVFDSLIWSAGNSGQKSGGAGEALGGGGGGCFPATIPAASLSATTAITVGAGGAARAATATGALGGDSSIGTLVTVKQAATYSFGGAVMVGTVAVPSPGGLSTPDFGYITGSGTASIWGGGAAAASSASNGSIYGGGAGGSFSSGSLRTPGASSFGGAGGAAGDAVSGTDGTAPGGGGGGTRTGAQSGAGARGEVRIWGVA